MKPALHFLLYVDSYSLMMMLGFLGGWLLARSRARTYSIRPAQIDNLSLLLPIAGLFGARLFARLFYAKLPLFEALKFWKGDGLVFYGGFIFCIGVVVGYAWMRKIKLISLMDCLAPSVAVGLAFGRIGCFLGGCCWGDVCVTPAQLETLQNPAAIHRIYTFPTISQPGWPFAVTFPKGSEIYKQHRELGLISETSSRSLPVHPVQLYEAALAALLAFGVHRYSRHPKKPGNASLALLLGYAFIRFGTEFLRADNKIYAWGMTFSQVVSVWIVVASATIILVRALFSKSMPAEPPAPIVPELASQ